MRMLSTENSYWYSSSSSNLKVPTNILREHQTCEVPRNCLKPFSWDCGKAFFEELFNARKAVCELGIPLSILEGVILGEKDFYLRL